MAGFGLPQRTPTQDANEGTVDAPETPVSERAGVSKRTKSADALATGLNAAGATIGSALQGYMDAEAEETRHWLENQGAAQQGEKLAMDELMEENRRAPWAEAVFGKQATRRGAQQRAAQNNVNQLYLEQAHGISEYAGNSPEEYQKHLGGILKETMKTFAGDIETQNMLAERWNKASADLAGRHAKEFYSNMLLENRQESEKNYNFLFDSADMETEGMDTDDRSEWISTAAPSMFNTPADGMTPVAHRSMMNDLVNKRLREGNIIAFDMSIAAGLDENLSLQERVARDQAITAYDGIQRNQASQSWETLESTLSTITSADQIAATLDAAGSTFLADLDELELSSSGSEASKTNIAQMRNKLPALKQKLLQAGATEQVKRDKADLVYNLAYRTIHGDEGAASELADPRFTTSEIAAGQQKVYKQKVASMTGTPLEEMTNTKMLEFITNSKDVSAAVASMQKKSLIEDPYTKKLFSSLIRGYGTTTGTDGAQAPLSKVQLDNLMAFDNHMYSILSGNDLLRWEEIKTGTEAGWSTERIGEYAEARIAAKTEGMQDLYSNVDKYIDLNESDTMQSRSDYLSAFFKKTTGQFPTSRQLADLEIKHRNALQATKKDRTAAEGYMKGYLENDTLIYKGQRIAGAAGLNQLTDYPMKTLLDMMQHPFLPSGNPEDPNAYSLLSVGLHLMGNTNRGPDDTEWDAETSTNRVVQYGKPLNSLDDISRGGWEISENPQGDGFNLKLANGTTLVYDKALLSTYNEELQRISEILTLQEEINSAKDLEKEIAHYSRFGAGQYGSSTMLQRPMTREAYETRRSQKQSKQRQQRELEANAK